MTQIRAQVSFRDGRFRNQAVTGGSQACDARPSWIFSTTTEEFIFFVDDEKDKQTWMEELKLALHAMYASVPDKQMLPFGWRHRIHHGTLHSAALLGEIELISRLFAVHHNKLSNVRDSYGMSPLHWTVIGG